MAVLLPVFKETSVDSAIFKEVVAETVFYSIKKLTLIPKLPLRPLPAFPVGKPIFVLTFISIAIWRCPNCEARLNIIVIFTFVLIAKR
jgi:hypothetical protein